MSENEATGSYKKLKDRVLQLEKANEALRSSFKQIASLQVMARAINATHDTYDIFEKVMELTKEVCEYRKAVLLWQDPESSEYVPDARLCGPDAMTDEIRAHVEEGLLDWAVHKSRVTIVPISETNPEHGSYLIMPFVTAGGIAAVLHAETPLDETQYEELHFEMLNLLASQAATALENAKLWADMENFKDYMRDTIESLQQGVMVLDARNQITLVNKASQELLGMIGSQVIGLNWVQSVPLQILDPLDRLITEALMTGQSEEREVVLEREGKKEYVAVTASLLRNARGEGLGVILALRDLTESKELSELRRLDQLKTDFLSNVSHELRTPMTSIKAYTETLLEQVEDDDVETRRDFLGIVKDQTDLLSRLIDDLLDLSRIERNQVTFRFKQCNLLPILQAIPLAFRPTAPRHEFVLEVDEFLPSLQMDEDKIRQVLNNLVSNAVKYSPDGGVVMIRAEIGDGEVIISVKDDGIGIAPEDQSRVFEKFFRVDTPLKYQVPGTGLGLAISQQIVLAHKGRIWLESEFGKGTTAYLSLSCESTAE